MSPQTKVRPVPNCSIARAVDIVGDRWAFLIVREAHFGSTKFAEFRQVLGIAPNILTSRLIALVEGGILEKRDYRDEGERVRSSYHLTEAGEDLKLVLAALQQWGDEHVPRADGPTVLRRDTHSGGLVSVGFVDEQGKAVPEDEVVFEPIPGGPSDRSTWR